MTVLNAIFYSSSSSEPLSQPTHPYSTTVGKNTLPLLLPLSPSLSLSPTLEPHSHLYSTLSTPNVMSKGLKYQYYPSLLLNTHNPPHTHACTHTHTYTHTSNYLQITVHHALMCLNTIHYRPDPEHQFQLQLQGAPSQSSSVPSKKLSSTLFYPPVKQVYRHNQVQLVRCGH